MSEIKNPGEFSNQPSEYEKRKRNIADNVKLMTTSYPNYRKPIPQSLNGIHADSMPVDCTDAYLRGGGYESFLLVHTPSTEDDPIDDFYTIDARKAGGEEFNFAYSISLDGKEKWQMNRPEEVSESRDANIIGKLLFLSGDESLVQHQMDVGYADVSEIDLDEAREVDKVLSLALREIGVEPNENQ